MPHLTYSTDLSPNDFCLRTNLEKEIRGCLFRSNGEVMIVVEVSARFSGNSQVQWEQSQVFQSLDGIEGQPLGKIYHAGG